MAINRDTTFFGADGYGFVSQDSAGISIGVDPNNVELHTQNGVVVDIGAGVGGGVPVMARQTALIREEFVNGTTAGALGWIASTSGTGGVNVVTGGEAGSVGQIGFEKGTGAGSTSRLRMSDMLTLAQWDMVEISWIMRKRDSGGGGESFSSEWGLLSSAFTSAISIYSVHNGVNSLWVGRTNNAGVVTDTNLVSSGGDQSLWRLQVRYESAAYTGSVARVLFYVNDVLYATHTTNIPTAVLSPAVNVAWLAGAAARSVRGDTMQLSLYRIAGRY